MEILPLEDEEMDSNLAFRVPKKNENEKAIWCLNNTC